MVPQAVQRSDRREDHLAKKLFYLIQRKDVTAKGKPVFYCRFRTKKATCFPFISTPYAFRVLQN